MSQPEKINHVKIKKTENGYIVNKFIHIENSNFLDQKTYVFQSMEDLINKLKEIFEHKIIFKEWKTY